MGATLASALLGLIRTRLLIQFFYADKAVVDVFWAAFRVPDMIFRLLSLAPCPLPLSPVFSRYIGRKDEQYYCLLHDQLGHDRHDLPNNLSYYFCLPT